MTKRRRLFSLRVTNSDTFSHDFKLLFFTVSAPTVHLNLNHYLIMTLSAMCIYIVNQSLQNFLLPSTPNDGRVITRLITQYYYSLLMGDVLAVTTGFESFASAQALPIRDARG